MVCVHWWLPGRTRCLVMRRGEAPDWPKREVVLPESLCQTVDALVGEVAMTALVPGYNQRIYGHNAEIECPSGHMGRRGRPTSIAGEMAKVRRRVDPSRRSTAYAQPATVKLLLIGFVGGGFSGALGVGGGIVMVPLLVGFLAVAQRHAHAVSLGAIVPISLVGLLVYGLAGSIDLSAGVALGAGGVVGARGGARLLVASPERALKLSFGLLMCASAGLLVLRA